jgi:hypothetical protein
MTITFAAHYKVFDPSAPDSFRAERTVLASNWDWHPLQVALVLGAVWHAKWQSRKRRNARPMLQLPRHSAQCFTA